MFAKDFFRNRLIVLLGLATTVMAVVNVLLVVVRVDLSQSRAVLRHWLINGNSQLYSASPAYLYSFAALAVLVLISSWVISYKIYGSFKPAAYFVFLFAIIVLSANLMVGEVLLRL
ncbi:hypothetical protein F4X86_02710 [Candidatus Saccharibacteria bacterium]|nr:hypothetical protein [Candidatus Saccharibacteria bacterium]